jgi:hypothetical protein
MARIQVEATSRSTAPVDAVWTLLADRPSWPEWSPLGRYEAGAGVEGTVGAVCTFVTNGIRSEERLVELVPGARLSYELLSGLPMRGYRADVDLTPDGTGTTIRWASSFEPKIPGTGWLFRAMMRRVLGQITSSLATAATRVTARP